MGEGRTSVITCFRGRSGVLVFLTSDAKPLVSFASTFPSTSPPTVAFPLPFKSFPGTAVSPDGTEISIAEACIHLEDVDNDLFATDEEIVEEESEWECGWEKECERRQVANKGHR